MKGTFPGAFLRNPRVPVRESCRPEDSGGGIEWDVQVVCRPSPRLNLRPIQPGSPQEFLESFRLLIWRSPTASAALRRFSLAISFVYVLLLTMVLYSSGPVTPLMQNLPHLRSEKKPRLLLVSVQLEATGTLC